MEDNLNSLKGITVAILIANGFEQIEMEKPRHALERAGAKTVIISPEKTVQGWHHMDKGDIFPVDVLLNAANSRDYDALLLPGGVMNPDQLRTFPKAIIFAKEINQQNKPIAAICHGPWLLINADAVNDRQVTSWSSIQADLINAGARWVDEPVVHDHNLITSRKPDDIPQFNEAMIKLFQSIRK
jgi:protease I